jgi:hypothetical protein
MAPHVYDAKLPRDIAFESPEDTFVRIESLFDEVGDANWKGLVSVSSTLGFPR